MEGREVVPLRERIHEAGHLDWYVVDDVQNDIMWVIVIRVLLNNSQPGCHGWLLLEALPVVMRADLRGVAGLTTSDGAAVGSTRAPLVDVADC